jgi:transposase
VCYEAVPTGYDLAQLLRQMGVACEVIAPSMIPKAPGDKVKTDTRDCRRLSRLHRPGSWSPSGCRPRWRRPSGTCAGPGARWPRTWARNRLTKFLLRHSNVWRGGSHWTVKHEAWLAAQGFDDGRHCRPPSSNRAVVTSRDAQLVAVEADLKLGLVRAPFVSDHRIRDR